MKRFLLSLAVAMTAGVSLAHATPGIYGTGVELQTKQGAGMLTTTLYATNDNAGSNGGDATRLVPTGSTATLNQTSAVASPETNPTFTLGTFNLLSGDVLTLRGFSVLTYVDSSTATQVYAHYRLFAGTTTPTGSFTDVTLPFDAAPTAGSTDGRWDTESLGTNLLTGLTPGTYTLGIYYNAGDASNNFAYDSNGGANYGVSFTVVSIAVPEPGTWVLLISGLGMLAFVGHRRLLAS